MDELLQLEDVRAVAVVRRDGLMLEHRLPAKADPQRIAAMSAAILGTGEVAAEAMGHGRFLRSIIQSDQGKILSTGAGPRAVLVALVGSEGNVGLILLAVERAGTRVAAALEGMELPEEAPSASEAGR